MVGLLLDRLRYLLKEKNIIANVIIGRMFNNKELLHVKYDDNSNVKLYENVSSMSTIMRNCDLAISANGTTIYELSAMAIPTISFAMVEEQVKSAEGLDALRVIDYCGTSYTDVNKCVKAIIDKALYYIENYDNRIRLAQNAHNLIDATDAKRLLMNYFRKLILIKEKKLMNILIIGASSFIGAYQVEQLINTPDFVGGVVGNGGRNPRNLGELL